MQTHSRQEPLTFELERAALRAILETYTELNYTFFRRALRSPLFELSDATGRLGRWVRSHRTLELSRTLLAAHGWGVLVEVLKHEMAHQYVDEVLGLHAEPAHGPAFRKVCQERAFDARASGAPAGGRAVDGEARLLERVAKLLALAESPNLHEAQAAMSAAQRLMLKYNLESVAKNPKRVYGFRHLGKPSGRVGESERLLAGLLAQHFFVEVIWVRVWRPLEARRGSVLEICGTPENVELGAYVHSFLTHTGERLWRDYKRAHGIDRNANRRTFIAGVMSGFRDKLDAERRSNQEQGLVWVGDGELVEFFRGRHPRVRWTRHAGSIRGEAWRHGREAGQRIVLHRGVSEGSSTGPRLLPGRRGN